MDYYLDLFTGATWREFRKAGSSVTGFRSSRKGYLERVKPGDVLLCYVTGIMHWVGALEVLGPSSNTEKIWAQDDFPVRFDVRPLIELDPEYGVPMEMLAGKTDFYSVEEHKGKFKGFLRTSPNKFQVNADGELILSMLKSARDNPVRKKLDPKKLAYQPPFFTVSKKKGRLTVETTISIPEPDAADSDDDQVASPAEPTKHSEIQALLLKLGHELGFQTWAARNDKGKQSDGVKFSDLPGVVDSLPTQFNDETNKTISYIDVLWLKGNSVEAAFEIESTTSIYSGLLRMSDLMSLQPNLDIRLFLVAPDSRRDKVEEEILRPTFNLRDKPIATVCGFISFSTLIDKVEGARRLGLLKSLKPEFMTSIAEYFSE